jgi:elongation factor Tu
MALPDKSRSHAVLIGASSYRDEALPDLPSVANNLTALRAALTEPEHGSFAPSRCLVIENPVDQSQVARQLADVAAAAEDVLLIYYTGHGLVGTRRQELFLGLSDTDPARPQYSALPFAWIRDELLDSIAATKVLILDCCFSGLAVEGFLSDQDALVQGQVSVRGTYTLAATPANMAALAPPDAEHTAFSGELLTLLREGVPAGPPELDLHLIYQRLARRMREEGWPTPKQYGTDNVLQLALARNPALAPPAPPAPAPPVVREPPATGPRPHLSVAVIGHTGHGKTTLTAAITKVLHGQDTLDEIRAAYGDDVHRGLPISLAHVAYETERARFDHVDFHHHADFVKGVLTGVVRLDAAILVVNALDGPLPGTRAQLELARQAGVPSVVVALTFADKVVDEELAELVEMLTRDLLSEEGYHAAPVVRVSAGGALDGEARWVRSVRDLVAAVEQHVPDPHWVADLPFLLAVEDVFSITGRGVVVTGTVEQGRVSRGTAVELVGVGDRPVSTVVESVEKFRKLLDEAGPGETVGLLLRNVRREGVARGQVVAAVGSATAHTGFEARVSFRRDNRPTQAEFDFRAVDVPGSVRYLPAGDVKDASRVGVRLTLPVAMAVGDRFTVRREGRTVGFGMVTEVTT